MKKTGMMLFLFFGISVLGYAQNSNGEKSNKAPKKVCPIPSRLQRWW